MTTQMSQNTVEMEIFTATTFQFIQTTVFSFYLIFPVANNGKRNLIGIDGSRSPRGRSAGFIETYLGRMYLECVVSLPFWFTPRAIDRSIHRLIWAIIGTCAVPALSAWLSIIGCDLTMTCFRDTTLNNVENSYRCNEPLNRISNIINKNG